MQLSGRRLNETETRAHGDRDVRKITEKEGQDMVAAPRQVRT